MENAKTMAMQRQRTMWNTPGTPVDTGIWSGGQAAQAHGAALAQHRHGDVYGMKTAESMLPAPMFAPGWEAARSGSRFGRRLSRQERMANHKDDTAVEIERQKGIWGTRQEATKGMWADKQAKTKGIWDNRREETAQKGAVKVAQANADGTRYGHDKTLEGVQAQAQAQKDIAQTNADATRYGYDKTLEGIQAQAQAQQNVADLNGIWGVHQANATGMWNAAAAGAKTENEAARAAEEARRQALHSSGAMSGSAYRLDPSGKIVGPDGKPTSVSPGQLIAEGKKAFEGLGFDVGQLHRGQIVVGLANVNGRAVPRAAAPGSQEAANLITDPSEIALYDAALAEFLRNDTPQPRRPEDSISAQ